jgi:hypothetical protein
VANKYADDVIRIGYAKCKVRLDEFNGPAGIKIATGRADGLLERGRRLIGTQTFQEVPVPQSMEYDLGHFVQRAKRFFNVEAVEVYGCSDDKVDSIVAASLTEYERRKRLARKRADEAAEKERVAEERPSKIVKASRIASRTNKKVAG